MLSLQGSQGLHSGPPACVASAPPTERLPSAMEYILVGASHLKKTGGYQRCEHLMMNLFLRSSVILQSVFPVSQWEGPATVRLVF